MLLLHGAAIAENIGALMFHAFGGLDQLGALSSMNSDYDSKKVARALTVSCLHKLLSLRVLEGEGLKGKGRGKSYVLVVHEEDGCDDVGEDVFVDQEAAEEYESRRFGHPFRTCRARGVCEGFASLQIRKVLRDLHVQFGHPAYSVLQRVLRRQGAKVDVKGH